MDSCEQRLYITHPRVLKQRPVLAKISSRVRTDRGLLQLLVSAMLKMQRQVARKLLVNYFSTPVRVEDSLVGTLKKTDFIINSSSFAGAERKINKSCRKWVYISTSSETKCYDSRPVFQRRTPAAREPFLRCNSFTNLCCCSRHTKSEFSTIRSHTAQAAGIIEIPLAQTGEGIADCELLTWFVNEGDEVDEFQPLCSVQSDKATIQITSRYKGKVSRLNFIPGDVIKVGESLLELISGSSVRASSKEETSDEEEDLSLTRSESDDHVENSNRKVLATPAIRHLAQGYGIKLEDVSGSGKDGRILKEDLINYLANKEGLNEELVMMSRISPKAELATPPHEDKKSWPHTGQREQHAVSNVHQSVENVYEDKIIHVRGYWRIMVKAMTAAAAIPHFYLVDELDLDALVKLKKDLKDAFTEQGIKLTYLPLMIKALSVALVKYPLMNSTCNEDASEICCRGPHNVGVAIATSNGLAVPNIKNVQSLSVLEISKELSRLSQLATTNQLSSEDISGGTITVSNFGSIGGKVGYPLLNLPEVAIVAFGRIHKAPRFAEDGSIYPASLMNVTLAADHRVLDGATLVNFCNEWKTLVEHPERLVIHLK